MNPEVWGPPFWFALHSITFNYPINPNIESKERIRNFFNSLEYILPCQICKVHYSQHIRKHPIETKLSNRKDLVYWLIDIHNMVNSMNHKQLLPYNKVIKMYEKAYRKKIYLDKDVNGCESEKYNVSEEGELTIKKKGKYLRTLGYDKKFITIVSSLSGLSFILILACIFTYLLLKKK